MMPPVIGCPVRSQGLKDEIRALVSDGIEDISRACPKTKGQRERRWSQFSE